MWTIYNNGNGIDVAQHPTEKDKKGKPIWIPELILGELLTSKNYNKKGKTTGGKNGSFWATQYHPEYDLKEMARLINAREKKLTFEGYFKSHEDMVEYTNTLEAIAKDPSRKDLRWMTGIDNDLLNDEIRQCEFGNWLKFQIQKK